MQSLVKRIMEKYEKHNLPVGALFEVTKRCIAHCIHCYLDEYASNELSIPEIDELFAQMEEIGIVSLGLTGGEPFARDDFFKILRTAKKYRFYTSILTTGITIDSESAIMLSECGVRAVEMSLHGPDEATHDSVMRYQGAFDKLIRAVPLLHNTGIHVTLKTTVLRENHLRLPEMKLLAKKLGVDYKISLSLIQKINGDHAPLLHGLSHDELLNVDLADVTGGLIPEETHSRGALLVCNAGRTVIGIGSDGVIYPCILFRESLGNIRSHTLRHILVEHPSDFLIKLRALREDAFSECRECAHRCYCRRCPGTAYTETGKLGIPSRIDCELAEKIHKVAG